VKKLHNNLHYKHCYVDQIKKHVPKARIITHETDKKEYQLFVAEPQKKKISGRLRLKWKYNISTGLKEYYFVYMHWTNYRIHLHSVRSKRTYRSRENDNLIRM